MWPLIKCVVNLSLCGSYKHLYNLLEAVCSSALLLRLPFWCVTEELWGVLRLMCYQVRKSHNVWHMYYNLNDYTHKMGAAEKKLTSSICSIHKTAHNVNNYTSPKFYQTELGVIITTTI